MSATVCELYLGECDCDRNSMCILMPLEFVFLAQWKRAFYGLFSFVNIPISVGNRNDKPTTKTSES